MRKKKSIPAPKQEISEILTQLTKLDETQKKDVLRKIDKTRQHREDDINIEK